jgi:hypothetical protein
MRKTLGLRRGSRQHASVHLLFPLAGKTGGRGRGILAGTVEPADHPGRVG